MVSLRSLVSFSAVLPAFVSALTTKEIVYNIKTLTTKSQALQAPAQSITIINGPLIVIGLGPFPQIITGFTDIVQTATVAITAMQADPDHIKTAADATLIADAFREFVRVHQVLLNILIGKAGLFTTVPIVGAPVPSVLRAVEGVVDTIAFGLIDVIDPDTQKSQLIADHNWLSGSLDVSISSYEGLNLGKKVKREFVA